MFHAVKVCTAAARPASVVPTAPFFVAIALSSVSAYRFWLTFISTVAISRSGGDSMRASTRRSADAVAISRRQCRRRPPPRRAPRCRAKPEPSLTRLREEERRVQNGDGRVGRVAPRSRPSRSSRSRLGRCDGAHPRDGRRESEAGSMVRVRFTTDSPLPGVRVTTAGSPAHRPWRDRPGRPCSR